YSFAKIKQDELLFDYGNRHGVPYVIVRPGYVYGPGNEAITGRVGLGTFGIFLHLGGGNKLPLTYVDNCAQAIVLAGLKPEVEGQFLIMVNDILPRVGTFSGFIRKMSMRFLRSICRTGLVSCFACTGKSTLSGPRDNYSPLLTAGSGTL